MSEEIIAAAKIAATKQIESLIAEGQKQFLSTFGTFVKPDDLTRLKVLFVDAAEAKAAQFAAPTAEVAQEFADEYDAYMDSIETIGDDYEIVGKAKAGFFIRWSAHQIISAAFAIGGAVLQVALGIAIPGIGIFVGAAANAGLQHVVAHYLENI